MTTDWRTTIGPQFSLLSDLCQLANNTIYDSVHRFLLQSFVASTVLSEDNLNTQLNATFNQLFRSTIVNFGFLVDIVQLLMQVDQPFMGSVQSGLSGFAPSLGANITGNGMLINLPIQITFLLTGPVDINTSNINCICATNSQCKDPVSIYFNEYIDADYFEPEITYVVPGSRVGCSPIDSLQLSTLQCFYSDSDCFPVVMSFIQQTYIDAVSDPLWFDPRPLIYDPTSSRFPPNTSIEIIVKDIMIEQWNPSTSYERFYELCAPNYCTYSQKGQRRAIFEVAVTLVSLIGGLIVSLRVITPQLVKCLIGLLGIINKRHQQQEQQRGSC
ncbi:unnamed protein product [Adineta steineri]|uniref:Uncharacterized protein n=1 Tax=Adineta steineri TaxID=433720 RepID=A0A815YTM6_9BILA|nr:unnamed protein product [Adineta steineri]CAF1560007.1 unnamed protein product [Adineta steineri]CAF1574018.1 unnamed protein product [Adineta steineri]CAF1664452.1 unnamed protein product [Adineta steineri]